MKKMIKLGIAITLVSFIISCKDKLKKVEVITEIITEEVETQPLENVMTKEDQEKLTPDVVLQDFKDGNARFNSGNITRRNHSEQIRKSAPGQFPKAVVLSCLDSRVPVEDVFDQGIGDVFVGRVAGNFINEDLFRKYGICL